MEYYVGVFVFSFFLRHSSASSSFYGDTTRFVHAGCSKLNYTQNTPFQYNLNSLLASLANSASTSTFAKFTSTSASPSFPVYGYFQCRGDLSIPSCHICVRSAITQLAPICTFSSSAAIQLRGCSIRYGNDSFLDQPDKTLLYRRCGSTSGTIKNGYEADLVGMREGVLEALVAGGQTALYRAMRVGNVDGVSQCVGDQTVANCGECVEEAVKEMRDACGGPAVTGEVYLGKCYVVYSSASPETRDHGMKVSRKEIAVIVGVSAAALALILLLYFLGKYVARGKG